MYTNFNYYYQRTRFRMVSELAPAATQLYHIRATHFPTCYVEKQARPKVSSSEITERPRAPSGVAAFMSAHSKTPYITP